MLSSSIIWWASLCTSLDIFGIDGCNHSPIKNQPGIFWLLLLGELLLVYTRFAESICCSYYHTVPPLFWMFLREFLYLAERTNFWIDRQGVGLTIYPAAPSGLFFFFFSNRWAKMKEREGQREEKDEHPSPFAPYRNRWLGLISKNNMRTDEAPPPLAQNPKGGAKYRWGTLTFFNFFPQRVGRSK